MTESNYIKIIKKHDEEISREEYLKVIFSSSVVLDLNESIQTQWTVRLIDGLCCGKIVVSNSSELDALPDRLRKYVVHFKNFDFEKFDKRSLPDMTHEDIRYARKYFSYVGFLENITR